MNRSTPMLQHPEEIAERIVHGPPPRLIALDVDGTLAPIATRPEEARVPRRTLDALRTLVDTPGMRLALLTGRDARALRRLVPIEGVWRAVEHGSRWAPPQMPLPRRRLPPEARHALRSFERWASEHAVPHGAAIERKRNAVGLHVRPMLPKERTRAEALLQEAARVARRLGLHPRDGRAMLEAEAGPRGDKGSALRAIARSTGARTLLFAGDDTTDLPALAVARTLGGTALFVASTEREPPPEANAVLPGPDAVARMLEACIERLSSPRG